MLFGELIHKLNMLLLLQTHINMQQHCVLIKLKT